MIVLRKTLRVALLVGFIVSLSLFVIVILNGEMEPTGQTGFVAKIHHLQQPGSTLAHNWFPCAPEGGCQYFKIVPATVLLNALLYAGILFIPIYIFRLFSTSLD